jgi:hypothetical protein
MGEHVNYRRYTVAIVNLILLAGDARRRLDLVLRYCRFAKLWLDVSLQPKIAHRLSSFAKVGSPTDGVLGMFFPHSSKLPPGVRYQK